MEEGKLKSEVLESIVFNNIKYKNKEILMRSEIGEDCAAIDFGEYACIISTDPITGAKIGTGKLAVHISCNDIASSGVKPIALMITILAPTTATEEDIQRVMEEAGEASEELEVEIIGGHTEVTSAVNRMVISTTAFGKITKGKIIKTSGAEIGDDVVMTKSAGFEGTSILAFDREDELLGILSKEEVEEGKAFINKISVVKEGLICAEFGVNSMHDITEGGVFGAAWEIAKSSNTGIELYLEAIPIHPITKKLANIYKINPNKLISSGSLLITCKEGSELVKKLIENGIEAAIIGRILQDRRIIKEGNIISALEAPETDELFKLKGIK